MSSLKDEFLNTLMELAPDVDSLDNQENIIQLAISKYNKMSKDTNKNKRVSSKVKESQIVDSLLYALDQHSEDNTVRASNELNKIIKKAYKDIGYDLIDDEKLSVFFDESDEEPDEDDLNYEIHDGEHEEDDCFDYYPAGQHRTNWRI